ncbi:MAG: propanediol utilization protein [Gammaproteobacteria bacterium]|nr:MAG: propanediol utilization protein [Gammaproteobacteria bacterium]
MSKGYSGINVDEISVEDVRRGDTTLDDIRIHPDTLEHQAQVAESKDNPQLASNFRRAAELTRFSNEEVLSLYEALRPGRSTAQELRNFAQDLASRGAQRNAEFFAQAADDYERRGLAKK